MSAEYTLVVGTKNSSSWSLRGYLAMRAVGVPFEEIVVPLHKPNTKAEILIHSPSGKVPLLKIAEHKHVAVVWDSLAICETLAERHPQAGILPVNPTKRMQARAYAAEMHSSFLALRNELSMDFARAHPLPSLSGAAQADVARILEAWQTALAENRKIGPFLFGHYSIADILYAPVVSRLRTYAVPVPEAVADYCETMMALPPMQDWMAAAKNEIAAGLA